MARSGRLNQISSTGGQAGLPAGGAVIGDSDDMQEAGWKESSAGYRGCASLGVFRDGPAGKGAGRDALLTPRDQFQTVRGA